MVAATSCRFTPPLPEGWSALELVEDTIVVDGLELRRAGVAATGSTGEEMLGAAAELGTDLGGPLSATLTPMERASYELLERIGTIEALNSERGLLTQTIDGQSRGVISVREAFPSSPSPDLWRFARSNGVALHSDWASAARHALAELVERDRILRSWYGEIAPSPMDLVPRALVEARSYDWQVVEFPGPTASLPSDLRVVSVFGFPRTAGLPFVGGHGSAPSLDDALERATREAVQSLAFLWGEAVPTTGPPLSPTAAYHLEYWQPIDRHEILRRWLSGEHTKYHPDRQYVDDVAVDRRFDLSAVTFIDLTSPWLSRRGLHLVKAMAPRAVALTFGDDPFSRHLPQRLRVHPIA